MLLSSYLHYTFSHLIILRLISCRHRMQRIVLLNMAHGKEIWAMLELLVSASHHVGKFRDQNINTYVRAHTA